MALVREDFIDDAAQLGCDVEAIMAVADVESAGGGFNPDGTPKTLFEGHWFSKLTGGKWDKDYPTISYPKWTKQFYGRSWSAEQARLALAVSLDLENAYKSASWGMFQVMGFNHAMVGYPTVQEFVDAMSKDENSQLQAFTNYIINAKLVDKLKNHDWAGVAKGYNGPQYKANKYDEKLAAAYARLKGQ